MRSSRQNQKWKDGLAFTKCGKKRFYHGLCLFVSNHFLIKKLHRTYVAKRKKIARGNYPVHHSVHAASVHEFCINQRIILTTNQASQIIASQIRADFSIHRQLLYLSSSPAEVTIKNHPYIAKIKAINPRTPKTRFVTHLITFNNSSFFSPSFTPVTLICFIAEIDSEPPLCRQKEKSFPQFARTVKVLKIAPINIINASKDFIRIKIETKKPPKGQVYYVQEFAGVALSVICFTNQKMILITNRAIQIKISHCAACFKIVNHELYLSSSPAEVTIWNPQYIKIINAIKANIPNIQLIAHFTTLRNESFLFSHDQTTEISFVFHQWFSST